MELSQYEFLSEVFLRAPFYSYEDYDLSLLPKIIDREDFRNAIYLASPDFYSVLNRKSFDFDQLNDKEKFSLYKYYNRMSFRSTPFGSFASFSDACWGDDPVIELVEANKSNLHLLPDQKLRMQLFSHLKHGLADFKLRLNPICYLVGKDYRFVKTIEDSRGHNNFSLETIAAESLNISIANLLKTEPRNYRDLILWIRDEADCSIDEAADYLDFLINEQFIYTPFSGSIIIVEELFNKDKLWNTILSGATGAFNKFKDVPLKGLSDILSISESWKKALEDINIKIPNHPFYSAVERPVANGGLDINDQKHLAKAVEVMQRIAVPFNPPNLEKFIKDFKERFDMAKVPLLVALDPDTGLSYGNLIDDRKGMEILDDINFPESKQEPKPVKWAKIHQLILKEWVMNKDRAPYAPVVLNATQFLDLDDPNPSALLPSTLALMFRKQQGKILIESLGGSTATSLIGRFTIFSNTIDDLCTKLANYEIQANENVVFADIGQLSDTHVDNINRRKKIYDYEILINVYSTLKEENQIRPDDLLVSVVDNELILESKLLKKRVIPRLTTAYNPTKTDLSIFRLFCDLQHQGLKSGMSFEIERLFPGMSFYPAVEFGNVVLCPAKWIFKDADLKELKNCSESYLLDTVAEFRKKYGLPECVMLGSFDQQLVFNLTKKNEVQFFLECIKNEKNITLKEFSAPDNSVINDGKPFAGQFIAFMKHDMELYKEYYHNQLAAPTNVQRNFIPGSSWLFLKLFCTPQTANQLITEIIKPIVDTNQALFSKWFFIRYLEKGYHLRIRINATIENQAKILSQISSALENSELIKDYQIDTYKREIERYGADLIDDVETLFSEGSSLIINYLKLNSGTVTAFQLATLMVIKIMDSCLPDMDQQLAFLDIVTNNFLKEFQVNKGLKMDLDKKFRAYHQEITDLKSFEGPDQEATKLLKHDLQRFLDKWQSILLVIHDQNRATALMADVIHMQINRLFPLDQRKHELIIYYCLNKFFLSQQARNKKAFHPLNEHISV